ncbi:FAD-dependent monooxygenase [Pseudonocardia sp.]|jgi:2-polyprenyl-6-methoxyphenol hydroxylase-like FAD-dependent oxidoreductase|uniref:FAD-dependent monooxygenase n=1 Tax=Pseudonocardia sp. TaxID=60912 RepID=UPI0031FD3999
MDTNHSGRRALVVGLGISGMATAVRLRQIGWDPVVIEKAPGRRSGGYFVAVFGAGRASAERLGILDKMPDRAPGGAHFEIDRLGNRRRAVGFGDGEGGPRRMLRGDVERALFDALPQDVEIRYSTVPKRIAQDADGVEVTLLNTAEATSTAERFDLVVGADGLHSTVRALAFGPPERYLHPLDHTVAAFQLSRQVSGLDPDDTVSMVEPGRAMWVFSFAGRLPTVLLTHRTTDVDVEVRRTPAEGFRAAFGPEPTGKILGQVLTELENADQVVFDSVEQVRMDHWHNGRVVLVGDSAWCVTLYSGMGVSAGLAGAELLGTMLQRHSNDIGQALSDWERRLRPFIKYHQRTGLSQRVFFNPANWREITQRKMLTRGMRYPVVGRLVRRLRLKGARMKELDIAAAA